jgi:hypothetical protein
MFHLITFFSTSAHLASLISYILIVFAALSHLTTIIDYTRFVPLLSHHPIDLSRALSDLGRRPSLCSFVTRVSLMPSLPLHSSAPHLFIYRVAVASLESEDILICGDCCQLIVKAT